MFFLSAAEPTWGQEGIKPPPHSIGCKGEEGGGEKRGKKEEERKKNGAGLAPPLLIVINTPKS